MSEFVLELIARDAEPRRELVLHLEGFVAFVEALLARVHACLPEPRHLFAISAGRWLMPASPVRKKKGYTRLYAADSDLVLPSMTMRDDAISPREGMDLLFAVATGPETAELNVARFGLWSSTAALVVSAAEPTPARIRDALLGALEISDKDEIRIQVDRLQRGLGALLAVSGHPMPGAQRWFAAADADVGRCLVEHT